ncbi:MAG: hypothetical protein ACHP9Y_02790 [Gammaproteobacteria bacterium]
MNKNIIRFIAPLAVSIIGMSAVCAEESAPSNIKVYEGSELECGLIIDGNDGSELIVIKGDIKCDPAELRPGAGDEDKGIPSAAVNILGNNLKVRFEDDIYCNGRLQNLASDFTDEIGSIGVWVAGDNNVIEGVNAIECNVGIEVGFAPTPSTPPAPRKNEASELVTVVMPESLERRSHGHNIIKHSSAVNCNAGVRLLNNHNKVRLSKASCGLVNSNIETKAFGANLLTSVGFAIGIKALNPSDNFSCFSQEGTNPAVPTPDAILGNETLPSVYHNVIELSTADLNGIGFLGGNEMDWKVKRNVVTNIFRFNTAKNIGDLEGSTGFLLAGTGHIVRNNTAFESFGNGVAVSLNNPACNPNFLHSNDFGYTAVDLNKVKDNHTNDNDQYGVAALPYGLLSIVPPAVLPTNLAAYSNAGTEITFNISGDEAANGVYNLFDANNSCVTGTGLDAGNYWSGNEGGSFPTDIKPQCVGN